MKSRLSASDLSACGLINKLPRPSLLLQQTRGSLIQFGKPLAGREDWPLYAILPDVFGICGSHSCFLALPD